MIGFARASVAGVTMEQRVESQLRHMIASRPGIAATGLITQATRLNFTSLTTPTPIIIMVRRGRKVIRSKQYHFTLGAGEAIAIAQGEVFDFENIPADDGDYEARWLAIEPDVIRAFADAEGTEPVSPAHVLGHMSEGLSGAFDAAVQALHDENGLPDLVIRHRVTELLAWLNASGMRFARATSESFATRIRRLVAPRPGADWSGPDVAAELGVSEATLRRRLQDEGTSLRRMLTDIRMIHAMNLLQSSRLPVSEIAASSGFESQSRFAIRFRSRFGFPPSAIRGHQRSG